MPFRTDPWPTGTPCWADLAVPDPAAAADLYSSVFGWAVVDQGEDSGHYRMASIDGHAVAGIGTNQSGPPAWTVYVASEDAVAGARAVTDHGGAVVLEPMSMPGVGTMAFVTDPPEAFFGIYQAGGHIGSGVYNQAGALVWTDTNVSDIEASRAFYAAVFGWTFDDVPGASEGYVTYKLGGDALGGLGGLGNFPPGTPSHWLPYLGTREADAAVAQFTAAGGTVLMPASETPFGRMAVVADPWGATVSLISVPGEGYETGT